MKFSLTLALVSVLNASVASAGIISTRTETRIVNSLEDMDFECSPGVAPNGHNYPTTSFFGLHHLDSVFAATNVGSIWTVDFLPRLGDHCQELAQEFSALLPAKLKVTQTIEERVDWHNGVCARIYSERLNGLVGPHHLSGSEYFIVGEVVGGCAE